MAFNTVGCEEKQGGTLAGCGGMVLHRHGKTMASLT